MLDMVRENNNNNNNNKQIVTQSSKQKQILRKTTHDSFGLDMDERKRTE